MHLLTLGSFTLRQSRSGDTALPAGKPLALLAYLLCQDGGRVTRDHLTDLLWANLPPERGRHSLRQSLTTLRGVLGPNAIDTSGETVRLATTDLGSDRADFLAALAAGDHDLAIACYRGSFLPAVAVPGGARFEHWAEGERERLQERWLTTVEARIRAHLAAGGTAPALQLAEAARAAEPSRQLTWRLLIESHIQAGNIRGARLEAEALRRMLDDHDTPPDPATTALLGRLGAGDAPEADGQVDPLASPELVGRDEAFAALLAAWRQSGTGHVRTVHLHGEAGIGKTRLLTAVADRIRSMGGHVVRARAVSGERALQHAALAACIRELARRPGALAIDPSSATTLVTLVPSLSSLYTGTSAHRDHNVEPRLIVAAVADLIRSLATEQHLVFLLDDLHWADTASLEVLGAALSRVERVPLLLVTASRATAPLPGTDPVHIAVTPLDATMITGLVSEIGLLPDNAADWLGAALHASTRGNPLLVIEALRSLTGAGALTLRGGEWQVHDRDQVESMLRQRTPLIDRIRRKGTREWRLMELLAVAGHPITEPVLTRVVDENGDTGDALAALELAGLIRGGPLGWEVCHDHFAEAIVAEISADHAAELHQGLARALIAESSSTEQSLSQALVHAVASGRGEQLPEVGRRWIAASGGGWHSPRRSLASFAATAGASDALPQLMRGVPLMQRTVVRVLATAAVLLLAGFGVWRMRAASGAPTATYQLQLVAEPILDRREGIDSLPWGFAVPISFRALKADGSIDSTADATVQLSAEASRAQLVGSTSVTTANGVARFDSVAVIPYGDSAITITASSAKHGVVGTVYFRLQRDEQLHLRIRSGELNGQQLDVADPVIRVAVGDSIAGTLRVSYRSDWERASVELCAVATWLPRESGYRHVAPLRTPVRDATIEVPIAFPAPDAVGEYLMILAFRAEPACQWIASRTNWTWKEPVWHDGNDLADLTAADLAAARERGYMEGVMPQDFEVHHGQWGVQGVRVVVE